MTEDLIWHSREELLTEIGRLREALKPIASYANNFDDHEYNDPSRPLLYRDDDHPRSELGPTIGQLRACRAAITVEQETKAKP